MSGAIVRRAVRLIPWSLRSSVKHVPGVAHLQRFLVKAALDGKTLVHEVDAGPARGVRFEITLPDDKGILTGTYEHQFASKIAAAVEPGAICYDIGGWHGFFAGVFASQGAGEVHIFEPLPANVRRIRRMVELNPAKRFHLHQLAAGETDGKMDLIVMPATSMAKLDASSFQPEAITADRIPVEVRSLDSLILEGVIPPADIIKLDVEGAEALVLRGARTLLTTQKPKLFIEAHSSALRGECVSMLQDVGYRVACIDSDMRLAEARDVFTLYATAEKQRI